VLVFQVFKPTNPWVATIMSLLAEIHGLEKVKLNITFEIEIICQNMGLKVTDLKPSSELQGRKVRACWQNDLAVIVSIGYNRQYFAPRQPSPPSGHAVSLPNNVVDCVTAFRPEKHYKLSSPGGLRSVRRRATPTSMSTARSRLARLHQRQRQQRQPRRSQELRRRLRRRSPPGRRSSPRGRLHQPLRRPQLACLRQSGQPSLRNRSCCQVRLPVYLAFSNTFTAELMALRSERLANQGSSQKSLRTVTSLRRLSCRCAPMHV
jgi:hypothetical protein